MKFKSIILFFSLILSACNANISAGSLGGGKIVTFPVPDQELHKAIEHLFEFDPQYHFPEKWKFKTESWTKDYFFLKPYFFYFKDSPEEMYYVTLIEAGTGDNPNYSRLAIRGVGDGVELWKKYEKLNDAEKARIQKRFEKEIITKLEKYTKTKSYVEK